MTGKIKCLQLCNDLLGSEVHQHLYRHLAEADLCQDIFYPLRRHKLALAAKIEDRNLPPVIVSRMLRKYHRVLFTNKIKWLYNDLRSKTDVSSYTIAHATTLFSDGALALRLNREFGIPYIVAVRASDFSFLRYRRNLHSLRNTNHPERKSSSVCQRATQGKASPSQDPSTAPASRPDRRV